MGERTVELANFSRASLIRRCFECRRVIGEDRLQRPEGTGREDERQHVIMN